MTKFKVGDLVRVRPKFWDLIGHKDEMGIVEAITPHTVLSHLVNFGGVRLLMSPDTLEKI